MPPEPLDYESREPRRTPITPLQPLGGGPALPAKPAIAVPAAFDATLVATDDHGAVGGIEAALRRASIPVFRNDGDGAVAARVITLYVAAADLERAVALRDEVFKRREKFRGYPRQNVNAYDSPRGPANAGIRFPSLRPGIQFPDIF